jgi:transcriptional regulator with XRE-family HTH domain
VEQYSIVMEMLEIDREIGERVRALRIDGAMTLDDLAERSGVSRAMLSRIERGESSPTAQLLNRVCSGLGVTLSTLFAAAGHAPSPLSQRGEQVSWRDPGSGYVRRVVSPSGTGSPVEMVEVEFPAGASVSFKAYRTGIDQHVWILEGAMEVTVGATVNRLETGDCLHMRLDHPIRFRNPFERPARYVVVLARAGVGR